ncbi:MAG: SDR family NAD(P)-dependent oxidoreductase [Candidatus Neomarinimicrobiota bacterium]
MNNLKGKLALITGASRGIGQYIAKTLAGQDITTILVARSRTGLLKTQEEIKALGRTCRILPWDLTDTSNLKNLVDAAEKFGEIDILVNNAGIENYNNYESVSFLELTSIVNTNLLAPLELSRLILPSMVKRGKGHIVTIASLAGRKGVAYNSIYSASKAGLVMWTDGLRQELAGKGVFISSICPGFISEAGMFFDGHLDPPRLLGTSTPQKVADAVLKALRQGSSELIVNKGPIRPLLALAQIMPHLGDKILKLFGVPALARKRISDFSSS